MPRIGEPEMVEKPEIVEKMLYKPPKTSPK